MLKICSLTGTPSFESYSSAKTEVRRFKKQLVFNDIDEAVASARARLGSDEFDCWGSPNDKFSSVSVAVVEDKKNTLQVAYKRDGDWEIVIRFIVKLSEGR